MTAPMPDNNDALRQQIKRRLRDYPRLNLHLLAAHCNGAALGMNRAEALASHDHEHTGPGTIRNHPRDDFFYDTDKAVTVLLECAEMDGGDLTEAVERLLPQLTITTQTGPGEHAHASDVRHWGGQECPDGTGCTRYPRLYDVRVDTAHDGTVKSSRQTKIDTPEDDITRGLLAARSALALVHAVAEDPDAASHGLLSLFTGAQAQLNASMSMLHPRLYPDPAVSAPGDRQGPSLKVTVDAADLAAVLQAADHANDRSLAGPVDRMGDALVLARMKADPAVASDQSSPTDPTGAGS